MDKEPWEEQISCNYKRCYAGMGVAGARRCFLRGDWKDPSCPNFIDEEEKLKELEAH